jgi:hypothetical protein
VSLKRFSCAATLQTDLIFFSRYLSSSLKDWRDLDGKAKVLDAADEAKDLLGFRTAIEVVGAEVLVHSAVLQHVVRSGENRCSNGADRLLRSSSGSQTLELGLKVAALGSCGGPGALDEGGFQPRGAPRLREGRLLRMRVDRRLPWAFRPRA